MHNSHTTTVWDPLVRIFHWTAVITFTFCYFTQEQNYEAHLLVGYVLLGITLIRVFWGFIGSRYARFSDFIYAPKKIICHLHALYMRKPHRYLGHNPAGGAMTMLLLIAILTITLSGIALDGAENRAGPLGDSTIFQHLSFIQSIHNISTNITLALIAIHLLGVTAQSLLSKENLVRAMITGRKIQKP